MSIELKQAAQQAIEAIQDLRGYRPDIDKAIEALRTAIQQAEAKTEEPVAWMASYVDPIGNDHVYVTSHYDLAVENDMHGTPRPLYTHPSPGVPDAVVRDAERYRWLRSLEHCNEAWCFIGSGNANSNLDAAIDAAMLTAAQAQKGQP